MKKFTILKNCHYSNFFPGIRLTREWWSIEKVFRFDQSCKYEIEEESCVNKLFGFCFGLFGVHKNSVRFGWTYNKLVNSIYIWSYYYKNGKLNKKKVFSCNTNEYHTYKIEINRISKSLGNYTFRLLVDNNVVLDFQELQSNETFITTLGPYFGGHTRAPHKMIVEQV